MNAEHRVGDIVDDYCTRCKSVMNHSVVSVLDGEPARTECRTCYSSHKYRHARGGKEQPGSKRDLFDEILDKMGPMGHR